MFVGMVYTMGFRLNFVMVGRDIHGREVWCKVVGIFLAEPHDVTYITILLLSF